MNTSHEWKPTTQRFPYVPNVRHVCGRCGAQRVAHFAEDCPRLFEFRPADGGAFTYAEPVCD